MKSKTHDSTRYKQKRGEGKLHEFTPWYLIHEISSNGVSWRVWSDKTKRVHHLLSTLEKKVMYFLDEHPLVIDIREQYPLKLNSTKLIAATTNIKHPFDNGEFRTLTTDFLVDMKGKQLAISVKPEKAINKRTIEKFQIEYEYWKERNIEWILLTEKEIQNLN